MDTRSEMEIVIASRAGDYQREARDMYAAARERFVSPAYRIKYQQIAAWCSRRARRLLGIVD